MYATTEEEKRAFCQAVMPVFLEYLRTHQSAIEQVELATVRDGIVSFPATQILGGVAKTVRVPLALIGQEVRDIADSVQDDYEAWLETIQLQWTSFLRDGAATDWDEFWREVQANWQTWLEEEDSRKGILCLDFSYDFEEGELLMDYVERDTLTADLFDYDEGDLLINFVSQNNNQ